MKGAAMASFQSAAETPDRDDEMERPEVECADCGAFLGSYPCGVYADCEECGGFTLAQWAPEPVEPTDEEIARRDAAWGKATLLGHVEADRDAWRDALRACYTAASADPDTAFDAETTGAYVAESIRQLRDGRDALARRLSNLLAVIHRDGGHYEAEHGAEKACADAEALVVARLDAEARAVAAEAIVAAAVEYLAAEDAGDGGQVEDDYSDAVRLVDARNALVALLPKETR